MEEKLNTFLEKKDILNKNIENFEDNDVIQQNNKQELYSNKKIYKNVNNKNESINEININENEININEELLSNDVCLINHLHNKCFHGRMNNPEPYSMSPIDKRYFKYNYQKNMTLQDYINWLWLYEETEDELPYIHLKNYYKLKKGEMIGYVPKNDMKIIKNMEDYYKKIYNNISDTNSFNTNKNNNYTNKLSAYNYSQYPTPIKM